MANPGSCKYRAFLSYSHRDSAAAKRLHGRLEDFRVDKDLVGRETTMGAVPKQLRPIFGKSRLNLGSLHQSPFARALTSSPAPRLLRRPDSDSVQPVRQLPPPPVFIHVGQGIEVDGGFTLDLAKAHSLEDSYKPGLLPPWDRSCHRPPGASGRARWRPRTSDMAPA